MTYQEILNNKMVKPIESGFTIEQSALNPMLKPFQKYCVQKALTHGRFALFEAPGLGKTIQQLEWGLQVAYYTSRPVILVAPLAVIGQTIEEEAPKFKYNVRELYKDINREELKTCTIWGINIDQLHNYLHLINEFSGVILDESSILKNFTGETKRFLLDTFRDTPYKLPCSASPAPNDLNEYGNHSEFLGILDAQDMRAKWFVRDEGMNNYRLKGHAKADFYAWLATWCVMFETPADIGFDEPGYILPKLNLIEKQVKTPQRDNGKLYNDISVDATSFSGELKLTKIERLDEVASIVNNSTEVFVIWVTLDDEADELKRMIPGAIEVRGNEKPDVKKKKFRGFSSGEYRVLITKTKIAQYGLNWQHCHNTIYASFNFSFEALYQSLRRFLRFGQKETVNAWLITTDTMQNVITNIRTKEKQFIEAQREVSRAINHKTYGLLNTYEFKEVKNKYMWLMKGDSAIELARIPDNSIDFIIFSPPFKALFTYSNYIHDLGNNESSQAFWEQYLFIIKELYRVLKPGRIMACHTKDLGVYKNSSGYTGMDNFTDEHTQFVENALSVDLIKEREKLYAKLIALSEIANSGISIDDNATLQHELRIGEIERQLELQKRVGFKLHSKTTIWCDPVLEMQRTKTQRLLYKTLTTNSALTGVGMAEYMRYFKKWDGSDESNWEPVNHLTKKNIPLDLWQKWASPVWMDIKRTDVLNNKEGTDQGDEKHIAPLQLEVNHRCINLWSNPGDYILTPFLGIGSEAYVAINNNRYAIGVELKDSYFDTAIKNCNKAIGTKAQGSLFETGQYDMEGAA